MNLPLLSEALILERIRLSAVTESLRSAFLGLRNGNSVQPGQTVTLFPNGLGDCIFYPAALLDRGVVGVKVSPYLTRRAQAGESPVTAFTLLLSTETGEPLGLCDALALTMIRTAATTDLAVEYLMPERATVVAVVGSGPIAQWHLRFAAERHGWKEIRVSSPTLMDDDDRSRGRRKRLEEIHPGVILLNSTQTALAGADVVMLCTSSAGPVFDVGWLSDHALVTSISTNAPRAHEIHPRALLAMDVFCDYRETAPLTAGEMLLAEENHGWSRDAIVADLPELIEGRMLGPWSRTRFFRSLGLGIEDLAISTLVVDGL